PSAVARRSATPPPAWRSTHSWARFRRARSPSNSGHSASHENVSRTSGQRRTSRIDATARHVTPPRSRRATASPERDERRGLWGPFRGPMFATRDRGTPRFTRGATSAGGFGAISGPPMFTTRDRGAPIHSGRDERWGVWGAISGPPMFTTRDRGAPRFFRGATSAGGFGGPFRGPPCSRCVTEERPDSFGARR